MKFDDLKMTYVMPGFPMDINIINDGLILPLLKDNNLRWQLPILPPDVTRVDLHWMAGNEMVSFQITALKAGSRASVMIFERISVSRFLEAHIVALTVQFAIRDLYYFYLFI